MMRIQNCKIWEKSNAQNFARERKIQADESNSKH